LSASPKSYSHLLQSDGQPVTEAYKAARRSKLLAEFDVFRPDIVVTEAYPMGRWAMDFELAPLLERVRLSAPRPMLVASLRDILQMPKTREKSNRSIQLFDRYYDHMLIHGDPTLVRIEESFPPLIPFLDRASYTGLVTPAPQPARSAPSSQTNNKFDVIVSAGGGAIGYAILKSAFLAKRKTKVDGCRWLGLAGPRMAEADFADLANIASANNVRLERFMPELSNLMATAQLSIQRAGYNTVADLLIAQCRSVLIPDSADRQLEQPLRAAKMAERGLAVVLAEEALTPERLSESIDQALRLPKPSVRLDVDGAARSAQILMELFASHQTIENIG
jgi:predicted glycosyltransferase